MVHLHIPIHIHIQTSGMYRIKDKISDYREQRDEKEEKEDEEEKEAKGRKAGREGNEGEKNCKMLIVYKEVGKSLKSKC